MRQITIGFLVLASFSAAGQGETQAFLSWYDGWGTHTVWGAGKVSGSYNSATIKCGNVLVPVRPILDTHESDGNPPGPTQTAEYAKSVNLALLRSFESRGDKCLFLQPAAANEA
jgi:hypothetical protein